jgi:hypothetical protein
MRADPRSAGSPISALTVAVALLLLLLGAGGYWLYQNVESYEEKGALKFSAKALRDPYLAADYFLRELGSPPRRDGLSQQLDRLPANGTVILTTPSNLLSEKQAAALLQWLDAGGHLIVVAGNAGENTRHVDPLLGTFGISREYRFFPVGADDAKKDDAEPQHKTEPQTDEEKLSKQLRKLNREIDSGKVKDLINDKEAPTDLTDVVLEDNAKPLKLAFDPHTRLQHRAFEHAEAADDEDDQQPSPFYWAEANGRVHFAQFEAGAGLLTVVSDLDFWTSAQIGKHDHALALTQLVGVERDTALISDADMPPLAEILWAWAAELWLGGLLVVVMWVWYRARRFGPIADPQLQIRRSLAEHILASATYLWRGGNSDALLVAARDTVLQRARQIFAEFSALDSDQQIALLHSQTGIDATAIRRALFDAEGRGTPTRDAQTFRDSVGVLQQLHLQLTNHQ